MANIDSNRNIVSVVRRIVRDVAMEIQAAHSSGKSGKGRSSIMGPLSRPRSKILRVAVSRIILSSEASKVKLVGNLVA